MRHQVLPGFLCLSSIAVLAPVAHAQQVVSDGLLNTKVVPSSNLFTITNGSQTGSNLFHSFKEFSIPTNGKAFFDLTNTVGVSSIFSRVTGSLPSTIDGIIQTSRPVSLFLINPQGILFGPNARLNNTSSFVGTTANTVRFSDGVEFNTVNPTPVLSVNLPIGLQFGMSPGPINLKGTGHQLGVDNGGLRHVSYVNHSSGLRSASIALIGGDLNLSGTILTSPAGRITLGSFGSGAQVEISAQAQGYEVKQPLNASLGNMTLTQRSLVDVSGVSAGSIQVLGQNIQIDSGSLLWSQNQGTTPGGPISVFAGGQLSIYGLTREGLQSGILSENRSSSSNNSGSTSPVSVQAQQILLQNGGSISTRSYSNTKGGNIQVQAQQVIADGITKSHPSVNAGIRTLTVGQGGAGNLNLTVQHLSLLGGAGVSSLVGGKGSGGELMIRASESIHLSGTNLLGLSGSTLSIASYAGGDAGKITVETKRITISDRGNIAGTSFAGGRGGDVIVRASESIAMDGMGHSSGTTINSSVVPMLGGGHPVFGNPPLTGNAGTVQITTPKLTLVNSAFISVRNEGSGTAGKLQINTNQLNLNGSVIRATTRSGKDGEIEINAQTIVLRNASRITTFAGGNGTGGNIYINSPIIVGLKNSDIIADAQKGKGGNIDITTDGLFGLKYRPVQTLENDITSSSGVGLDGTITINNFQIDPSSEPAQLTSDLMDKNQHIQQGCLMNPNNEFVMTGRGGIPMHPSNENNAMYRSWNDLRLPSSSLPSSEVTIPSIGKNQTQLTEVIRWQKDSNGQIELIAGQQSRNIPATCAH